MAGRASPSRRCSQTAARTRRGRGGLRGARRQPSRRSTGSASSTAICHPVARISCATGGSSSPTSTTRVCRRPTGRSRSYIGDELAGTHTSRPRSRVDPARGDKASDVWSLGRSGSSSSARRRTTIEPTVSRAVARRVSSELSPTIPTTGRRTRSSSSRALQGRRSAPPLFDGFEPNDEIDERWVVRSEPVGEGGIARVYRVYDTTTQRDYAAKFVRDELRAPLRPGRGIPAALRRPRPPVPRQAGVPGAHDQVPARRTPVRAAKHVPRDALGRGHPARPARRREARARPMRRDRARPRRRGRAPAPPRPAPPRPQAAERDRRRTHGTSAARRLQRQSRRSTSPTARTPARRRTGRPTSTKSGGRGRGRLRARRDPLRAARRPDCSARRPTTGSSESRSTPTLRRYCDRATAPRKRIATRVDDFVDGLCELALERARRRAARRTSTRRLSRRPRPRSSQRPNWNPYQSRLVSLFSQSRTTNAGTRGLDDFARWAYVETRIDRELFRGSCSGELRLVLITGNAGDGKTAFIQMVEQRLARDGGDARARPDGNGARSSSGTATGSSPTGTARRTRATTTTTTSSSSSSRPSPATSPIHRPQRDPSDRDQRGPTARLRLSEHRGRFRWLEPARCSRSSRSRHRPDARLARDRQPQPARAHAAGGGRRARRHAAARAVRRRAAVGAVRDCVARDALLRPRERERAARPRPRAHAPRSGSGRPSTSSGSGGDCTSRCATSARRSPTSSPATAPATRSSSSSTNGDREALLAGHLYNSLFAASDKLGAAGATAGGGARPPARRRRDARRREDRRPRGRRAPLVARRRRAPTRPAGVDRSDRQLLRSSGSACRIAGAQLADRSCTRRPAAPPGVAAAQALPRARGSGWIDDVPLRAPRRLHHASSTDCDDEDRDAIVARDLEQRGSVQRGVRATDSPCGSRRERRRRPQLRHAPRRASSSFEPLDARPRPRYVEYAPDSLDLRHTHAIGRSSLEIDLDLFETLTRILDGFTPSREELRGAWLNLDLQGPARQHPVRLAAPQQRRPDASTASAESRDEDAVEVEEVALMALESPHRDWRLDLISPVDVRAVGLDQLLTQLWLRVLHENRPLRRRARTRSQTVAELANEMERRGNDSFRGSPSPGAAETWLRADLVKTLRRSPEQFTVARPVHALATRVRSVDKQTDDSLASLAVYAWLERVDQPTARRAARRSSTSTPSDDAVDLATFALACSARSRRPTVRARTSRDLAAAAVSRPGSTYADDLGACWRTGTSCRAPRWSTTSGD